MGLKQTQRERKRSPTNTTPVLKWQSVSGITYFLQRSTNLETQLFSTIQSNIAGQANLTTVTDTTAAGLSPLFYRVGVQ